MRVHAQPQEAPAKVGKAKAVPGKEQEAKEIHGSTSRMAPPGHEGNNPGAEAEVHNKVGFKSPQSGLEFHTKGRWAWMPHRCSDTLVSWLPKHLHCTCKACFKASMLTAKACLLPCR